MIISLTVLSVLTSAVWAQQSNLVPSGISSTCTAFFTSLNTDTSLGTCITPLVSATSAYGPLAPHNRTATAASMTSTLDTFCSPAAASSCPASLIRAKLGEFYAACTKELGSEPNTEVITMYDVLYALLPLKTAVCSKDDGGKYCAIETSSPLRRRTTGDLFKRGPGDTQVALKPNATSMAATNLLFLFLKGDLSSEKLCTTCTRNILTAYIEAESEIPYAPGLAQSVLFHGQIDLYAGVVSTCGKTFLGGAVQAAGGIGSNGVFGESSSPNGARGARRLDIASAVTGLAAIGFALVL